MQPIAHPDPLYQEMASTSSPHVKTSFPLHWYVFFGILEPISVLAGVIYAIYFQENYYAELIPAGYLDKIASSTVTGAARKTSLTDPTRMALAQLGSCYFLIFLNSALMLFFIRRHFSHSPISQERVLYAFFFVLGAADWTHILLTIHYLPSPSTSSSTTFLADFTSKLVALADYKAWNSLLFGNIFITLVLFTFRAAWWVGIARDTFLPSTEEEAERTTAKVTGTRKGQ
ncbi:hypothetical protein CBS101457_006122 [Exobasidium rhododendri]|nr:hypothetical protein CBS101457_006122 [Exobasidium rhododendri]